MSVKVTPEGSVPDSDRLGIGEPVAVTMKLPKVPTVKTALFPLVNRGAWPMVKFEVAELVFSTVSAAFTVKVAGPVPLKVTESPLLTV